jgi:aspartyl-tRNA synthetase
MVAGVEKYFQIARCFRDEDLRADRQPEFTQLDVEASFTTQDEILALMEKVIATVFRESKGIEIPTPFPRLTYKDAMNRFGSDKPDTRFGMEITDLGDVFRDTQFKVFRGALDNGGVVKAINASGLACITTGQIENLTELAKQAGAKGLAFIKVENGEWKSPIVKFFTDAEKAALTERLAIKEGDLILFGADKWETACETLGRVRLRVAEMLDTLRYSPGTRRSRSGTPSTIPSPARAPRIFRCSRPANTERSAPWLTMSFSTASRSVAAVSGSMNPICSRRCSASSALMQKNNNSSSATS